jgi:cardiolipin synthase
VSKKKLNLNTLINTLKTDGNGSDTNVAVTESHPNLSTAEMGSVFTRTDEAWDAMFQAIAGAKKSIDIEQYIIAADTIGGKLLQALVDRAKTGVRVRVLCDMVGSNSLYYSSVPDELRLLGVDIRFFNPVSLWRFVNLNFTGNFFRDHRKLLVIDGDDAYVGGVNFRDDMKDWRDTVIQVKGEFVKNLSYVFDLTWSRVITGKYKRYRQPPVFDKKHEVLINSPRLKQRLIYHALIEHIRAAKKSVWLFTPYFVPDKRFMRVLRLAMKRGVDVRLMIPEVSDNPLVSYAQPWYVNQLLRGGGRVFLYRPSFMHAKYAIIDNEWATVGSCNFDNLSFRFNHELNIGTEDQHLISLLQTHAEEDFKQSLELTKESLKMRSIAAKLTEFLCLPLHDFL